ncbi:diguanylate cyclase [Thermodesulfatator indicus DSM 15286]|uniref:diguanylate cyclase n=1 Tax=Thermodesulfatator indicus (strain DSM 15286 / JCM 11887 / CIR29812) TaxID=667014 RepID=F8AB32_THEID|nr:diguanylate cyclase [Thermodesulfatator indicus]AEH44401.1 diguanylate cyclase [Thermodesulfatator indicus DSM 15286]
MKWRNKLFVLAQSKLLQKLASFLEEDFLIEFTDVPERAIEKVFNSPPELLLIEEALAPEMTKNLVRAFKKDLHLTFLPILLIVSEESLDKNWESLPVDDFVLDEANPQEVKSRLKLALVRVKCSADANPLTGLPGNTSILRTIQEKIDRGERVAVAYVDIDQFKPFNDRYGFARGDEILRVLARILSNVLEIKCREEGFVGHIGGDDFVFICPENIAEEVCQEIIKEYEKILPNFIDPEDLERGYFVAKNRQGKIEKIPFPSLSIAVVPLRESRFKHYGEVSAIASEIKKIVKAREGSNYFIDRRGN